jgi:molybdate transport system substrate-binding protein
VYIGMFAIALAIQVHAAASLTDVMREIGIAFQRATGIAVTFNFSGSSTIERQIENGAPGDVFVSADEAQMNALDSRRLILANTRRDVVSNKLVLVGVRSLNDLLRVDRIALADPRAVPAGVYAREYLTRAGLWARLEKKVIPTENVRAALAAVKAGNADAAIVYRTDSPGVVLEGPPAIAYPAAVLRESKFPDEARRFVEFLGGKEARAIFVKYGFIPK